MSGFTLIAVSSAPDALVEFMLISGPYCGDWVLVRRGKPASALGANSSADCEGIGGVAGLPCCLGTSGRDALRPVGRCIGRVDPDGPEGERGGVAARVDTIDSSPASIRESASASGVSPRIVGATTACIARFLGERAGVVRPDVRLDDRRSVSGEAGWDRPVLRARRTVSEDLRLRPGCSLRASLAPVMLRASLLSSAVRGDWGAARRAVVAGVAGSALCDRDGDEVEGVAASSASSPRI